jgi:hypothetical protein
MDVTDVRRMMSASMETQKQKSKQKAAGFYEIKSKQKKEAEGK